MVKISKLKNKKQNKKVVGIIMTYNCALLVAGTVKRIPLNSLDKLIIVDDGSKDDIASVAKELNIPLFKHKHLGYGGNIKFGLKKALELGGDYLVEIHGDGQYDPKAIPTAIKKMKIGYDFMLGSRFTDLSQPLDDKMPLARYLANIGLSFIDKLILRAPLTEYHSGFRVYSRKLLETVDLKTTSDDYLFSFEIIAQARFYNLPITEIPVRCNYKDDHTSASILKSAIYSFQMCKVLALYLISKAGFKTRLFR